MSYEIETIGNCTLYRGNCWHVLEHAGVADALITDPIWPGNSVKEFEWVWGIQSVIGNELVDTKKGKRRPSRYFHLVAGGTKKRETEAGKNRGSAPGDPFYDTLREKYDKTIKETINQILDEIESEIP